MYVYDFECVHGTYLDCLWKSEEECWALWSCRYKQYLKWILGTKFNSSLHWWTRHLRVASTFNQ